MVHTLAVGTISLLKPLIIAAFLGWALLIGWHLLMRDRYRRRW